MDTLADFSTGVPSLPWLWIIEYLASFKEVDVSILHDLIETAPELPDDLAKSTREMVALKCLEDLFGPTDKLNSDGLSAMENKIGFSLSENSEDILQHILQETSASELKMGGPELLKWDVHPFIMHKRASMPRCALQQLKDTILEGTHPLAAFLKESSGLMCVNECDRTCAGDLDHNVQAMAEKENMLQSTCDTRDRPSGDDLHNRNVSPSKRDRNDMVAGDMAGQSNESQDGFDFNHDAKKLKQDAISNNQSADPIPASPRGKETEEYMFGRVEAIIGEEGRGTAASQLQDEQMEESQLPEDCDNCDGLRRPKQNGDVNDDQIQHNQVVDGHNADKMPQDVQNAVMNEAIVTEPRSSDGAPSAETRQKDTVDKSKGDMERPRGEVSTFAPSAGTHQKDTVDESKGDTEVSSDNDKHQNERIGVATKKTHLLSSQCSLEYDSLAMSGWTDQNLCVKCNKDGPLLVCNTSGCPLVLHENCLGFPAKFDEKGNFHCPFCAYSLATSDYLEAKKKASLARKELAAFVQMGLESHPKELADILCRKDHNHSRSNGNKDIHANGHLQGPENNQENENDQCLHDVNDHLCQKGKGEKKQSKPAAACVNGDSNCGEEANEISGRVCVSNGEKVTEESMGKENTEGEHDKFIISNYSIRLRSRETHHTYPATPQSRRKNAPWTSKEEKMIKKGVRKFASVDDRNIPWKKILEYGSAVFLGARTTIDLKDKWRNMCKGSPRSK